MCKSINKIPAKRLAQKQIKTRQKLLLSRVLHCPVCMAGSQGTGGLAWVFSKAYARPPPPLIKSLQKDDRIMSLSL